jgi:diguanylate cyclase (GGDEF)-like protein/PAS domain S-box-containing protein
VETKAEGWQDRVQRVLAAHGAIIAVADRIEAVFEAVVNNALIAMPVAVGAVIEMREGDHMAYRAASGVALAEMVGMRVPMRGSLSGLCLEDGEPQLCLDAQNDPRANRDMARVMQVRAMIVVPIPAGGANVGVLKVYAGGADAFGGDDLLVARLLVAPIACGLAHAAQMDMARDHSVLARRFEATFEQAAVGIAHVSPEGRFLRVNEKFCQIAGRGAGWLYGCSFQDITHPEDLDADVEQLTALLAGEMDSYQMEKRYLRPDGTSIWINLTVSLVAHEDGRPDFLVAVAEDISRRKDAETLALRDALTGLPNRRAMLQRLELAVDDLPEAQQGMAVAYLDLDHFKQVNDRLGHAMGDECLVEVARAINGAVRQNDTLYRIAGDEFVLLLPGCAVADVERILQRLNRAIARRVEGRGWNIGVSAGAVVLMPGTRVSVEDVIHAADMMMYSVKLTRKEGETSSYMVRPFRELSAAMH